MFRGAKKAESWHRQMIHAAKEFENVSVAYCWTHAKVIAASIGDNRYVIEGSGNLSTNARIEQYVVENSEQMYDHHVNWMTTLGDRLTEKDYSEVG